jgi:hypothetical protein
MRLWNKQGEAYTRRNAGGERHICAKAIRFRANITGMSTAKRQLRSLQSANITSITAEQASERASKRASLSNPDS